MFSKLQVNYYGIKFDEGFKAVIIVENKVILELKAVENVFPVHKKQMQTYLKLSGCRLGSSSQLELQKVS